MIELRDYQSTAIDRARTAILQGARSVVLVSPTGSGKTVIGASIVNGAVQRGRKALWLAHRSELIAQSAEALERLGLSVGVVSAGSERAPNPGASVQVASIQTLIRRAVLPAADLVVFDECHHAASDTYSALLDQYRSAITIGLTATPERSDGRGLGHMFQRLVMVTRVRDLVDRGALVPCDVVAPGAPLRSGQIAQRPVDAYREHGQGRPALVFSPSLMMAERHATEFRELGIPAVMVDGTTPPDRRREAVDGFKAGKIQVLVNVQVFTEGTDLPCAAVAILARGCGTPGLYLQMVGRILRPHPGKAGALLIDLRGVSHIHGHPADDRQYSLEGRGIRRDVDQGSDQSYCRVCGAPIEPGQACDECGTEARETRPLTVTGDRLVRYAAARAQGPERRAENLAKWMAYGAERGWKPGAAFAKYTAVYGESAPRNVQEAARAILRPRAA